jgi:adenylylsulfate kinase-like enzyme
VTGWDQSGVVWVTGLAGVGKTTVADALAGELRRHGVRPIRLDGDDLRELLPTPLGHDLADRRRLARYYARLAAHLAAQGHLVICSTVSLFHEIHEWNRRSNDRYLEVWLRMSVAELRTHGRRRHLYGDAAAKDVVGVDASAEFPRRPDVVIDNSGIDQAVPDILAALREWPRFPRNPRRASAG